MSSFLKMLLLSLWSYLYLIAGADTKSIKGYTSTHMHYLHSSFPAPHHHNGPNMTVSIGSTTLTLLNNLPLLAIKHGTSRQKRTLPHWNTTLERNTLIPCKKTSRFTTCFDNQTSVTFPVYEGERAMSQGNNLLGTFTLAGISVAPRGVPQFYVTFDIDANSNLIVSAVDISSGKCQNITIMNEKGHLTKEELDRTLAEAEKYKEEPDRQREWVKARNELEHYVYSVKQAIDEVGDRLSDSEKNSVRSKCRELVQWIDNDNMQASVAKEEYEHPLEGLQLVWNPIISRLYQGASATEIYQGGAYGDYCKVD